MPRRERGKHTGVWRLLRHKRHSAGAKLQNTRRDAALREIRASWREASNSPPPNVRRGRIGKSLGAAGAYEPQRPTARDRITATSHEHGGRFDELLQRAAPAPARNDARTPPHPLRAHMTRLPLLTERNGCIIPLGNRGETREPTIRSRPGHARPADPQDPRARAAQRLGHRPAPQPGFGRRAAGERRVALSRAPQARERGLDHRRSGSRARTIAAPSSTR